MPPTPASPSRRSGRGRPRDEERRQAILTAAGDLMLEGGLGTATMEAIAARAGVSKQTIYNWWPSRGAVAVEGFMRAADPMPSLPAGLSAADSLRHLAVALVELFTTTTAGPLMRSIVAAAQEHREVADALRDQWLEPRREAVIAIVEEGVGRGEFRPDVDVAAAIDLVFAPLYYRLLTGHAPLDEAFARRSVDLVLGGLRRPGTSRRPA